MFEFFYRARGSVKGFKYQQDRYEKMFQSNSPDFEEAVKEFNDFIEVRFSPARVTRKRRPRN